MSRGFYSKHYVSPDKAFYFNAETGLSSWSAPVDGIVLEAPNAKNNLVGAHGDSSSGDQQTESAPVSVPEESPEAAASERGEVSTAESAKSSAVTSTVDEFLSSAWEQVSRKRGDRV